MNWYSVASESEIAAAGRKLFNVGELRLAVFHVENSWFAIDNHCPHRGGPVAAGRWNGRCITCPWHEGQYDLTSGQPLSLESSPLGQLAVRVHQGIVQVDLDSLSIGSTTKPADGIQRFVVRYGQGGNVGLFGTIHEIRCERGDQVIVQSQRGIELGTVLGDDDDSSKVAVRGELLRVAGLVDLTAVELAQQASSDMLGVASQAVTARQLGVQLVDADTTLDGATVIFYFIGSDTIELGPLAVTLGRQIGKHVRFQKLKVDG